MKLILPVSAGGLMVAAVAVAAAVGISASPDTAPTPTFNHDVAPIIFNSCSSCHRPNEIAPMSFMSYKEVRPWARAIKTKITKGEMPPWMADARYGEFRNDRRLTPEQLQTIVAWVDGGAPEGSTPLEAQVLREGAGWVHPSGRPPDIVIEMSNPISIPAGGEFPLINTYEPLPAELAKEDHFVEAYQFLPGEVAGVHHGNLTLEPLPPGTKNGPGEAWPGGPVIPGTLLSIKTGKPATGRANLQEGEPATARTIDRFTPREPSGAHFGPYLPGGSFVQYRPGAGKRIPHDAGFMTWSMHYTPTGKAFTDKSRVGIWFQKDVTDIITEQGASGDSNRNQIVLGKELIESPANPLTRGNVPAVPVIPANTTNWTLTAIKVFLDDYTLYSLTPHMHQRGKTMTYVLTYPDGKERVLLANLKYDFNWQIRYDLKEPIKIPAGSTVRQIGYYDNSAENRYNPAPQSEVYWSEQSWDEMFSPFMDLSVDKLSKKRPTGEPSTKQQ